MCMCCRNFWEVRVLLVAPLHYLAVCWEALMAQQPLPLYMAYYTRLHHPNCFHKGHTRLTTSIVDCNRQQVKSLQRRRYQMCLEEFSRNDAHLWARWVLWPLKGTSKLNSAHQPPSKIMQHIGPNEIHFIVFLLSVSFFSSFMTRQVSFTKAAIILGAPCLRCPV